MTTTNPVESNEVKPPDPTRVTRAIVYKGTTAAAELLRGRDEVVFQYLDDYLDTQGPAVATTLPISRSPYRTRGASVPAFFAGLLPEGRRLQALPASLKTSADDDYSMLVAIGRNCIGDVSVLPEDVSPNWVEVAPLLARPEEVSFDEILEEELALGFRSRDKTVPGVQGKLSDSMLSLPVRSAAGGAILKLSPTAYPLIVENEAFVLDMARAAGLRVPVATLVRDRDGRSGLVVERFDRHRTSGGITRRIAQEDAVQLANRLPADKYRMTTKEVFDAVIRVATAKPVAAENLLRQFTFSYVAGNGDLHSKNVSVQFEPEGIWAVTPAYDLVCTLPYADDRLALDFDGRDKNLTGKLILEFGKRFSLNERVVRRMVDEIVSGVEPLIQNLDDIGFGDKKTVHMQREMAKRLAQIQQLS